jgi:hypothetical protein
MSTKLGFHVASAKRSGAGDLLRAGAALVVCVDQNMIDEAKRAGAVVAFRTQRIGKERLDNPKGIDNESLSNIPARAFEWMKQILPIWKANQGAHYYLNNNEWDIGTLDAGVKINTFALECMRIAETMGYKLGVFNFSTGCPSDDPVDGKRVTMEQRMETILPALSYAAAHGHAVSLHVHTAGKGSLPETGEWIALRFQRLLRFCRVHGFLPKILITELSNGTGGVQPNPAVYLSAVRWWNAAVQASEFKDQVVGGALYGFNADANETLTPVVPQLVQIMTSQPTPPPQPDQIVVYRGTCPLSAWERVAAQVVAAGGTIERL